MDQRGDRKYRIPQFESDVQSHRKGEWRQVALLQVNCRSVKANRLTMHARGWIIGEHTLPQIGATAMKDI